MRSEEEIYRLLLETAEADDRILAVYMNGSRTNPKVPRDIFQDYDIVYVVGETKTFIQDRDWIHRFGKILYMQYPDEHPDYESDKENHYGWLMQFEDGVRIDLTVQTSRFAREHIHEDRLCRILLDKGNILPSVPESTDENYYVKKPTEPQFQACANEFWWCSNNIAKGLWREEMPYVQDMANFVVRKQLEKMLSWKVGIETDFQVSVGKSAKYLYRWLEPEEYQGYLDTYFGGNIGEAWRAVFHMCSLFERTAEHVGSRLGYTYNAAEGKAARGFLEYVWKLPMKIIEYFTCARPEYWLGEIKKSDWKAGQYLYELLSENKLKDSLGENAKVLMLTHGEELVSFCTYSEKDDIQPTELAPWIGFVYTFPKYRGRRFAGELFREIENMAKEEKVQDIFISTNHMGLYEKYGYEFYQMMADMEGEPSRVYRKHID